MWFLTGFWHGASWTFIAWGFYFALLISIEKAFLDGFLNKLYRTIRHLYLVIVVMIGWIFFRADNFSYAFDFIKVLFGFNNNFLYNNLPLIYLNDYGYILVLSTIFSIPIVPILKLKLGKLNETNIYYFGKALYLCLCLEL